MTILTILQGITIVLACNIIGAAFFVYFMPTDTSDDTDDNEIHDEGMLGIAHIEKNLYDL